MFQFPHHRDIQRVIDNGPWSFENQTLVCKQVLAGMRPEDVVLDTIEYWVQIHDLLTMLANAEFVEKIVDYVGSFQKADPNNFWGTWNSFFRIKVSLKVNEPLKKRMKLRLREGVFQWITFKYERLNTFLFCCGLIGHSDRFCRKAYEEGIEPKDYLYGAWMRAGARRQIKPVGAKWLFADLLTSPACVLSTTKLPSTNPIQIKNVVVL